MRVSKVTTLLQLKEVRTLRSQKLSRQLPLLRMEMRHLRKYLMVTMRVPKLMINQKTTS